MTGGRGKGSVGGHVLPSPVRQLLVGALWASCRCWECVQAAVIDDLIENSKGVALQQALAELNASHAIAVAV